MGTVKRGCVVLLVTLAGAWACSDGKDTATSPSPSPATTFSLSGQVRNGNTGASVGGATVSVVDGPNAGASTTTDMSGNYSFTALQQSGFNVNAAAANYISQAQVVTLTSNRTLDFSLRPQPVEITLTGRVTDAATGGPIAGAVVSINWGRYMGTTDSSGSYSVAAMLDAGSHHDLTYVSAANYVSDYRYIQARTVQNVRLHRIERIVAGESKLVTVAPDDTLCVNNMQDFPGLGPDYLCRSVFVLAPNDGAVTIEAVSTQNGEHPPLEVEIVVGVGPCCYARMGNPMTIQVAAGTVIVVNVEMLASSTSVHSFVVNTSLSAP